MEPIPQEVEKICCVCGAEKYVHKHRRTGNLYCIPCLAKDDSRKEICGDCKKLKPVYKRLEGNRPQCQSCYRKTYTQPKETCTSCKKNKPVHIRLENGEPQCKSCRKKTYTPPKETCSGCKKAKPVHKRIEGNRPQCVTCYNKENMGEYLQEYHEKKREKKNQ